MAETDELLDATTALVPPLLNGLEAMGYAGRHMHPPNLSSLVESVMIHYLMLMPQILLIHFWNHQEWFFSIGNTFFIRMYFMVKVVKKMLQEQMDLLLPTSKTLLNLVEEVLSSILHVPLQN